MSSSPSSRLVTEQAAALLRVTIDAAPLIAAATAELPTNRGILVTFAYHHGSVTARFDSRLTPRERDTVTLAITQQFQAAEWGYTFDREGIDLTHPDHLTRYGDARTGPATLTDALAAVTARPPEHDTAPAPGPTDTVSLVLAAAGHTALAAAWHTANANRRHNPGGTHMSKPAALEPARHRTYCGTPDNDTELCPAPASAPPAQPRHQLYSTLD